jgi:hypothetical protein
MIEALEQCNASPRVRKFIAMHEIAEGEYTLHKICEGIVITTGYIYYYVDLDDDLGNHWSMFLTKRYRSFAVNHLGEVNPPLRCIVTPHVLSQDGTLILKK